MDWINKFYSKQYELKEEFPLEIKKYHKKLVDLISQKENNNKNSIEILELGAGCGQFAVSAAEKGFNVTAVELVSNAVKKMEKLSNRKLKGKLNIIEGDFYKIKFDKKFDYICYWDGFGVGEDSDQKKLLKRIEGWLKPEGTVLIDIYTPWYWAAVSGRKMEFENFKRKYDFNPKKCRMLDSWWEKGKKDKKVTQSLRCYSPADFKLLLKDSNLKIRSITPNGGVNNYKKMKFVEKAVLINAFSYRVFLEKD